MQRTVGVAIDIPQPWGAELDAHRAWTGDPAAPMIPSHVTLLGPAILPASPTLDSLIDRHLVKIARRCAPFAVHLRGTGTFRPINPVVFVALADGISECERLATWLNAGPLARELTYPYHPHVTVAHAVPEPAMDEVFDRLAGFTAIFTVAHFTRYEHSGDGQWKPIRDYPLAGIRPTPGGASRVSQKPARPGRKPAGPSPKARRS